MASDEDTPISVLRAHVAETSRVAVFLSGGRHAGPPDPRLPADRGAPPGARGVPRSTAMKRVGHKTESVYRRYAIVDEAMLKEGADKLARLGELQAAAVPALVSVPFSVPSALRTT